MKIATYHLDAFSSAVFSGNPAMVCVLNDWLDDARLQAITVENHLPVTAFVVAQDDVYGVRWFTRTAELDLCGHGTLAAASVVFEDFQPDRTRIRFESRSGPIDVLKQGDLISLDFPLRPAEPCSNPPDVLIEALGAEPQAVFNASHCLAIYGSEADIRAINPNLEKLLEVDCHGVVISAPGDRADFVSRYFAPRFGISEDAATGSTHCMLAPYWWHRLGQRRLHALQLSSRGGEMWCEPHGDLVRIAANVTRYAQGSISI